MPTLICDCNKTMPLDAKVLGTAIDETLSLHTTLCRRQAGEFQRALQGGEPLLVACTQEQRLFAEIAEHTERAPGVGSAPLRFVNIRETGGWSRDAAQAMPKIAALLAAAKLPEPEPVATVTYKSQGRLLLIGPLDEAEKIAASVADVLDVTLFAQGGTGAQDRRWPVLSGRIDGLAGWLGAFELAFTRTNPIALDLCTRCNACIAVCPEGAIGFDYQINLDACQNHRACVTACGAAGAIDFTREPQADTQAFDLVLDLREGSAFPQHAKPQGYLQLPACAPCCSCASWWASSRSPGSSTTSKSSAPTAATRSSAAAPASISARPRRSAPTRRASRSRSTPTCAWAAAPAPPSVPPAR
jgi:ferredoxin